MQVYVSGQTFLVDKHIYLIYCPSYFTVGKFKLVTAFCVRKGSELMKSYNKPNIEFIELVPEEKFAGGSKCEAVGYCTITYDDGSKYTPTTGL